MSERLYVVVRADLPIGLQMAQVVHVALRYGREWWVDDEEEDETVVVLWAKNEQELKDIRWQVWQRTAIARCYDFAEPDLGGELTVIMLDGRVKDLVRHLPLAFAMSSPGSSGATAHSAGTCTATGGASS